MCADVISGCYQTHVQMPPLFNSALQCGCENSASAGTGSDSKARAHLRCDDPRQCGLAEPWRPGEEHVVDRLVTTSGGFEDDRQLLFQFALADEVGEPPRTKRCLKARFALVDLW